MTSLWIRSGGGGRSYSSRHRTGRVNARERLGSLVISNHFRPQPENTLSVSRDPGRKDPKFRGFHVEGRVDGKKESWVVAERRLDEWMLASVGKIVENLLEAPLIVQMYERNQEGGRVLNLRTETEVGPDYWDAVRAEWENGETSVPDGMMFVEELTDDEEKPEEVRRDETGEKIDQIWGIVVQGKVAGCSVPACYLLKTTRVTSGLGLWGMYFFLMRVNNFQEKAKTQLRNCWLVRRPEDDQRDQIISDRIKSCCSSGICKFAKK